jgi:hypothetical protein
MEFAGEVEALGAASDFMSAAYWVPIRSVAPT